MNTTRILSAAVLVVSSAFVGSPALAAHPEVEWSVRIGVPIPVPVLPLPLPRVQVYPAYPEPAWRGHDRDRDGVPDWRDRYDNRRDVRAGWGDRDRDGIPDRYDRYDNRRPPPGWRHGHSHDRGWDNRFEGREHWDYRR